MTIYPLELLPFDTYHKVLTVYRAYMNPKFAPTTMEDDLRAGTASALIYWYPQYSIILYDCVLKGIDYQTYFEQFNTKNYWYFREIFNSTAKKLDNLLEKKLNNNILDETRIINSKLR